MNHKSEYSALNFTCLRNGLTWNPFLFPIDEIHQTTYNVFIKVHLSPGCAVLNGEVGESPTLSRNGKFPLEISPSTCLNTALSFLRGKGSRARHTSSQVSAWVHFPPDLAGFLLGKTFFGFKKEHFWHLLNKSTHFSEEKNHVV